MEASLFEYLNFPSGTTDTPAIGNEPVRDVEFPLRPIESTDTGEPEVKHVPVIDFSAFLKRAYPLNVINTKFVNVGVYQIFNYMPGVLFLKQGYKRFILVDKSSFEKVIASSEGISFALQNLGTVEQRRFNFEDCSIQIRIRTVFHKPHVEIKTTDGGHSIMLNSEEWTSFIRYLPVIKLHMNHLSKLQTYIKEHIDRVMSSNNIYVPPPQQMDGYEANLLSDEVASYKYMQHSVK